MINKSDALQRDLRLFESSQRKSSRLPSGPQITAINLQTKSIPFGRIISVWQKGGSRDSDFQERLADSVLFFLLLFSHACGSSTMLLSLNDHGELFEWRDHLHLVICSLVTCTCSQFCSELTTGNHRKSLETDPQLNTIKVAEMKEGLMLEIKDEHMTACKYVTVLTSEREMIPFSFDSEETF